tara:strand:+ start:146 stop:379 length:234 start_codon:yes stop_codon:yes gene_type:complete
MDFIVSYHLYSQIKKKGLEEKRENLLKKDKFIKEEKKEENNTVNYTCPRCGQDPYFCQCKNNVKEMYKYFNPEKDIY